MIESLKQKVLRGGKISMAEAISLSSHHDKEALYRAANEIREYFCDNHMDLCSITNAKSGQCTQDCKWCSQSKHHNCDIEEYEMVDPNLAVEEALSNSKQGVKRHSLVTSGRKVNTQTLNALIPIFQEIAQKSDIQLCASMGLISEEHMRRLKNEANITHYHCNIETAPSFFTSLVTTHTLEDKIDTIRIAQKVGLKVCSGGIIGMGETMEQRIEMSYTLRVLNIKSIPINILHPVKGTPLENHTPLSEEEILTTIAIFRFMHPDAQLRFAGGRMQLKDFQNKALKAGINAALTGDYLTTTGSNIQKDIKDFTDSGFKI